MASSSDENEEPRGNPLHTVFLILAVMALWGVWLDVNNTHLGGSLDLRNRVTGARIAAAGEDPYFFKWSPEKSDRLYDPHDSPDSKVNTPTVTPSLLTVFTPFNGLPYRATQWIWLAVEYAFLVAGFWAWAGTTRGGRDAVIAGGILTCLFCVTPHWRLHVDRGQSYIILASLLLVARRFEHNLRPASGGVAGALLLAFRPTNAVLLGLPVARRSLREGIGMAAGLAVAAALPLMVLGSGIWRSYFQAMDIRAHMYLEKVRTAPGKRIIESVEGIPIDTMVRMARIPFADSSIYKLIPAGLSPTWLLGGWAALAGAGGWWMARRGRARGPVFFWALSAWLLVGDYLLPAYRYDYNHALLWPVLLLGLGALEGRARSVWVWLSSALLVAHFAVWIGPKAYINVPGALSLAVALGAAVWAVFLARPEGPAAGKPETD